MTPSQEKRRARWLIIQRGEMMRRWAAKQIQQQIGADPARNVGGTDLLDKIEDGGAEIIIFDNLTEKTDGI